MITIYGLHQSGRFVKFSHCNCAYIYQNSVILLYADDFVLFSKDLKGINLVVNVLSKHFDFKALGKTRKLLGVGFEEVNGSVLMHQSSYIKYNCDMFSNFNVPIHSLPINKSCVYSKSQSPQTPVERNE